MNLAAPIKAAAPAPRRPFDQQPALAVMTQPAKEPEATSERFERLTPEQRTTVFYCQNCGREKRLTGFKFGTGHCVKCNSMWFATKASAAKPDEWQFEVGRPKPKV